MTNEPRPEIVTNAPFCYDERKGVLGLTISLSVTIKTSDWKAEKHVP